MRQAEEPTLRSRWKPGMKLVLGIVFVALAVALVYAGAFTGSADRKVRNLFLVIAITLAIAVAALWLKGGSEDDDARPANCGTVWC